jgi:hypothetical protein
MVIGELRKAALSVIGYRGSTDRRTTRRRTTDDGVPGPVPKLDWLNQSSLNLTADRVYRAQFSLAVSFSAPINPSVAIYNPDFPLPSSGLNALPTMCWEFWTRKARACLNDAAQIGKEGMISIRSIETVISVRPTHDQTDRCQNRQLFLDGA